MAKDDPQRRAESDGLGPCARLTHEVLQRLATAEVCERIVADALADAGLATIPEDPSSFGSFACGSLRVAVEETLGEEAASAVIIGSRPDLHAGEHGHEQRCASSQRRFARSAST